MKQLGKMKQNLRLISLILIFVIEDNELIFWRGSNVNNQRRIGVDNEWK
jgi:hypothetical protein